MSKLSISYKIFGKFAWKFRGNFQKCGARAKKNRRFQDFIYGSFRFQIYGNFLRIPPPSKRPKSAKGGIYSETQIVALFSMRSPKKSWVISSKNLEITRVCMRSREFKKTNFGDLTSISDKSEHRYTLAIKKVNNKKIDFETTKKKELWSHKYIRQKWT